MSHLWIERLRARFEPAHSIGLAIGRQHVGLVRVRRAGQGAEVEVIQEAWLTTPLFIGQPDPAAITALSTALADVGGDLGRQYLPVHVSLPDAAVRITIFELDALPKTRAEQQELTRWRLQQEAVGASVATASQALGQDGERHLLLGVSMDEGWQSAIRAALAAAGIVAWSLSADVCRQFNRYHDRFVTDSGALVSVSPDSWSLLLWDGEGRARYARARWRGGANDHADIAAEVERSIVAYVHSDPRRTVARVYVLAGAADGALPTALNARLREPCTRLDAQDDLVVDPEIDLSRISFPAAVAAALEA